MAWAAFQAHVPGKWVLTGEHAVIRGQTAIALPLADRSLFLQFRPHHQDHLSVIPNDAEVVLRELIEAFAEKWEAEGRSFRRPHGTLGIQSTIPIGAGLGSSAALCVAFSRWIGTSMNLPESEWTGLATQLEHRFHGRSSGMDVAVISANTPISFTRERGATALGIRKLPKFTFHDTGLRCRTSECVVRVERFREDFPTRAMELDEAMGAASRLAMEGLFRYDAGSHDEGLVRIGNAMRQAQECFLSWELVPGDALRIENELRQQGALAVKMTGAGGGGMLVALWAD
ncbi:MAG: mevalonate kinase family protein [Bdellovibrionota bacterium]